MKLFIKDHLSVVALFFLTTFGLPLLIQFLDGFGNHIPYYIFLSLLILALFLTVRYLKRKKLYNALADSTPIDNISTQKSFSSIEKAYLKQLTIIKQEIFLNEVAADKKLEIQETLINHSVHQLKTPLASMHLFLENNQEKLPQLDDIWETLLNESQKLDDSLNQLLLYTRTTHLMADIKIEALDLEIITKEVINDLRNYFIQMSIFPKLETNTTTKSIIYSDKKWLKAVVYQILTNAIKYSDSNHSVIISVSNKQLRISNIGETIPKSDIKRVFDLFYTGNVGRKSGEATGIGLYLVKEILSGLNHDFELFSKDRKTTFTITFNE